MNCNGDIKKEEKGGLPSFLSQRPDQWRATMATWGEPKFRANQLVEWIFSKRIFHPDRMTNLSKALRQRLLAEFDWSLPTPQHRVDSEDQTTKILVPSSRGLIETVLMRYKGRTSLCVSSQVGCKLACTFCQTGKLGFVRHLTADEILSQFAVASQLLGPEERPISHIVFMGMGEPLDNFESVVRAVQGFTEDFGLRPKNVTVSTSGITPKITELARRVRCALAVSLHAARDELRTDLMPINRKYDLAALKQSLLTYQEMTGDKITFEYIMIRDKNCGRREAKDLVRFIHGLRAKVNLIPFNDHPGLPFGRPDEGTIREFQQYLSARSIPAPVRYSKGLDVSAACGQLAAKHQADFAAAPARSRVLTTQHSMN